MLKITYFHWSCKLSKDFDPIFHSSFHIKHLSSIYQLGGKLTRPLPPTPPFRSFVMFEKMSTFSVKKLLINEHRKRNRYHTWRNNVPDISDVNQKMIELFTYEFNDTYLKIAEWRNSMLHIPYCRVAYAIFLNEHSTLSSVNREKIIYLPKLELEKQEQLT